MKSNNIIIGALAAAVIVMSVAFAAFSTTLKINGTGTIASTWSIVFEPGICAERTIKDSSNPSSGTVNVSGSTAIIEANMTSPGDTIRCGVVVKNNGTLPAIRDSWTLTTAPSLKVKNSAGQEVSAYLVSLSAEPVSAAVLAAKNGSTVASETLYVDITFNEAATEKPASAETFKATATYVQSL